MSVGESVRIIRELQDHSQSGLAELTGIPQSTISGIENNRINIGAESPMPRILLFLPFAPELRIAD